MTRRQLETIRGITGGLEDVETLLEMHAEEGDASLVDEADEALVSLEASVEKAELTTFLDGPFDSKNAYVSIHPGAGGTESCDWAEILMRMYLRWAEKEDFEAEVLDQMPGEQAGIKSATIHIKGPYAFGHLQSERGVHRLVRISPYDSSSRRHTSFASVDVSPEIEEDLEIEIHDSDLRIDVYRSGGPGGQGVNTTDSAVRIVHEPSGIVVTCQNERSQLSNKLTAMRILKAKLYQREMEKQEEELARQRGEKKEIGWGSQIRSYVMQPYTMVKDLRTSYENAAIDRVLDGDLTPFIRAWLLWSKGAS